MTSKAFFFRKSVILTVATLALVTSGTAQKKKMSGSPILPGWYADPETVAYSGEYWVFPTYSAPFGKQTFLDVLSPPDLMNRVRHPRILDNSNMKRARRAMWTPAVIHANSKYYLFFGGGDVHQGEVGGIGVAVTDRPEGPYKDTLGKPLINEIASGVQSIDQFVFRDDDGQYYMYYGGWGHCNMAKLAPDLLGLIPFPDGVTLKEVIPKNCAEGPFMLKKGGKYYFMRSEKGWTGPDYCMACIISDSSFGPFERVGKILEQDNKIVRRADHHSVIKDNGRDERYIVYHRRPLTETDGNHRETYTGHMCFDRNGFTKPVRMTVEGVKKVKKRK